MRYGKRIKDYAEGQEVGAGWSRGIHGTAFAPDGGAATEGNSGDDAMTQCRVATWSVLAISGPQETEPDQEYEMGEVRSRADRTRQNRAEVGVSWTVMAVAVKVTLLSELPPVPN